MEQQQSFVNPFDKVALVAQIAQHEATTKYLLEATAKQTDYIEMVSKTLGERSAALSRLMQPRAEAVRSAFSEIISLLPENKRATFSQVLDDDDCMGLMVSGLRSWVAKEIVADGSGTAATGGQG